jgi:competence protein ComEA
MLIVFFLLQNESNKKETWDMPTIEERNGDESKKDEGENAPIIVDVKGAVKMPGVYQVDNDDRVIDVINMAGGLLEDANEEVVNFAQILHDEMVIYIPKIGEEVKSEIYGTESNKLNINKATVSELMTLNGIGEAKAQAIVNYRDENGKFEKIEDLLKIRGIGEKTLENFRDEIIAY